VGISGKGRRGGGRARRSIVALSYYSAVCIIIIINIFDVYYIRSLLLLSLHYAPCIYNNNIICTFVNTRCARHVFDAFAPASSYLFIYIEFLQFFNFFTTSLPLVPPPLSFSLSLSLSRSIDRWRQAVDPTTPSCRPSHRCRPIVCRRGAPVYEYTIIISHIRVLPGTYLYNNNNIGIYRYTSCAIFLADCRNAVTASVAAIVNNILLLLYLYIYVYGVRS